MKEHRVQNRYKENSQLTVLRSNFSLQSSALRDSGRAVNNVVKILGSEPSSSPCFLCELWQVI